MTPRVRRDRGPTQVAGYAPGRPLPAGETVVAGRYRCLGCNERHEVPAGVVVNLPVCPRCQGDAWELD